MCALTLVPKRPTKEQLDRLLAAGFGKPEAEALFETLPREFFEEVIKAMLKHADSVQGDS